MGNKIADTIDVPAETYSHAVPDDYDEETVEIALTAFGDKLYLKFPRFDRRGTDDFCMSASSIFRATIRVKKGYRTDDLIDVSPCLQRMGVLRKQQEDYVTGDDDRVWTTTIGDKSDADPAHLKLVEKFCTTVKGMEDDDYWQGYRAGASKHGDEYLKWPDMAWACFSKEWDGDKELLLDVGKWFAREGVAVCSQSKAMFPVPEWSRPTGSYVATISDVHGGKCPNCGADKSEHWECVRSSNRTRVANKYRCDECGHTKTGITTG